jgi:hypothetical protein
MSDEATPQERRALFQVVRGAPSDAELAALAAVLAAAAAGGSGANGGNAPARGTHRWSDPAARLRTPLAPGPDAWQRTYWPR